MESQNEGDDILLSALRQIECKSIGDDITTIGQLTPEMIVEAVAKSLFLITEGEIKINSTLPPNVASRHRICTTMATKIKELGYAQNLGYNQLLYPTEAQTKDLVVWLVQKLPRQEEDAAEEALGANALLNKRITESLTDWVHSTWKLHFCTTGTPARNIYHMRNLRTCNDDDIRMVYQSAFTSRTSAESSVFEQHAQELIADQRYALRLESQLAGGESEEDAKRRAAGELDAMIKDSFGVARGQYGAETEDGLGSGSKTLNDMLSALNDEQGGNSGNGRGTRFTHAAEFGREQAGTVGTSSSNNHALSKLNAELDAEDAAARKARLEEEELAKEKELEELRLSVENATLHIDESSRQASNASARIRQLETELLGLHSTSEALEKEILIKRKTLEMLPNATANIKKLQEICGASAARLLQLAQEWEKHRRPLVDEIRSIQNSNADRRQRCKDMMEEMKGCKADMVTMIQDLKDKQERARLLAEELEKLPKNLNRNLYTARIMDIISSITKQNKDIAKITQDIRDIQKTINMTSQTLSRSDTAAEDLIYAAANEKNCDKATVETYRGLTLLRSKFDDLMDAVAKIGKSEKEIQDFEVKIEQEMMRVTRNNFDRIKADLAAVRLENKTMVENLKKM